MAVAHRVTCKMCRREGVSVCGRNKCAVKRRASPPGVHGPNGYGKLTPFGLQLREKQKVKRTYGLREHQFQRYFEQALSKRGNTGNTLAVFLEFRLDTVLVRSGFASTHAQARQWVSHGHVQVNGKSVDIPSYRVKPGEIISFKKKTDGSIPSGLMIAMKSSQRSNPPAWLALDAEKTQSTIVRQPNADELPTQFNMRSIVEFYSR